VGFCTNCGAALPADAAFCPNCGRQVSAYTPAGGEPPYGAGPPPPPIAPPPPGEPYPARLEIDYPDRQLNRVSTFFRIFVAIPILIVLAALSGSSEYWSHGSSQSASLTWGGLLFAPVILMLLFRRTYPGWWFDWNLEFTRFTTRVSVFLALMDDTYPSTQDEQSVHLELDRPDGAQLSRGLPLIKWLLAIPHYFVLLALAIGAVFVVVIAWFAILFTGRYPRWAFDYMAGVLRWGLRVEAYAFLLITDRYPPFSMS
jgi:uncharacterized protein DUF4389/zinc ribbon protein